MPGFRNGSYRYHHFEKPEYEPIDTCTKCHTKFTPETKSYIMGSYFHTCPDCRARARAKLEERIEKNGGIPIHHVSTRCEFTGKCSSCKKEIQRGDAHRLHNRYYCYECVNKLVERENIYRDLYIDANRDALRNQARQLYQSKRGNGICVGCGERADYYHAYCSRCLEAKRREARAHYVPMEFTEANYSMTTLERLKVGSVFPLPATYRAAKKDGKFMPEPKPIIAITRKENSYIGWQIVTEKGEFITRSGMGHRGPGRFGTWSEGYSFDFHAIQEEEEANDGITMSM